MRTRKPVDVDKNPQPPQGRGTMLCFSMLLTRKVADPERPTFLAYAADSGPRRHDCAFLIQSRWLDDVLESLANGFDSPLLALRWVMANADKLKTEGVTCMVLDTLLGAQFEDTREVVSLLKEIRQAKLQLFLLDTDNKLMDIGSMDDVVASGGYIDMAVTWLIRDSGSGAVFKKETNLTSRLGALMSSFKLDTIDALSVDAVFRIPVWLEQHADGSVRLAERKTAF